MKFDLTFAFFFSFFLFLAERRDSHVKEGKAMGVEWNREIIDGDLLQKLFFLLLLGI